MEDDDHDIDYANLETVLMEINQKFIALPEDEARRNNNVLKVVDDIVSQMKNRDVLFRNLYTEKYYGGSFYEGLKISRPSEYDLDCLLSLPKFLQPKVLTSDRPGFVHIELENLQQFQKKKDEAPNYPGFGRMLEGNRFSTKKVLAWIEGLVNAALNDLTEGDKSSKQCKMRIRINGRCCPIRATVSKAGPALTLEIVGSDQGQPFQLDVDLVTCFIFRQSHWPEGYRSNTSSKKDTFFVVPKGPKDLHTTQNLHTYWRLSFQEQEKELLSKCGVLKPTIRLLKKLRDRNQHNVIASYFLKTIFLWELDRCANLWNGKLSVAFMKMLEKYEKYLRQGCIPYYWNDSFNLLGENRKNTAVQCVANQIGNIIKRVKANLKKDPFFIAQFLLSSEEVQELRGLTDDITTETE